MYFLALACNSNETNHHDGWQSLREKSRNIYVYLYL